MPKKRNEHAGKAGTITLTERDLDQVQGGVSRPRKVATSEPDGETKPAVGTHEITGALIKIN